jgi:hypothetical protein
MAAENRKLRRLENQKVGGFKICRPADFAIVAYGYDG